MFVNFFAPISASFLFPYIMLPGLVGEVGLSLWLLVIGVNSVSWKAQAEART
jgi:hypothetical protein